MPPILKKDLISPITSVRTAQDDESRVVDSILSSKVNLKNTTLIRYSGVKTTVVYLAQIVEEGNDYLVNLNSFNDIDQDMKIFIRVDDFVIAIKSEMTPDVEGDQSLGISVEAEGQATVLPRTIKPRPGDAFIMKQYDRISLYRVKNVTPKTFENDAGFEIDFALESDSFKWETHPIAKCIAESWKFESRHIGTDFRSVFRSEEYEALKSLRELYNELGEEYISKFFRKVLNTFLLEPRFEMPNFAGIDLSNPPVDLEDEPLPDPQQKARDEVLKYATQKIHDRELIHFIKKHSLFYNSDNVIHPTAHLPSRPDVYRDTIFGAIESRSTRRYVLTYQLPSWLNVATPGFPPQLFGKVDLSWTPSLSYGCVDLLPRNFYLKIKSPINQARSGYDKGFHKNFVDVLIECIAAYIKGESEADAQIVNRLNFIAKNSAGLSSIPDTEKFYLYPMIAKILLEMMMRLASENANTDSNSPKGV